LQYQTPRLTAFYERDTLVKRLKEREPQASDLKVASLRLAERAERWFFAEVIYIIYGENIHALFGINLIGSQSLIAYIIQRLCSAITSTASQGAWELAVLSWRKKCIENGVCSEEKANSQRDWAFLFGSLISVTSLAASLSPNPKLGYYGFCVLVIGAISFFLQTLKMTAKQKNR